MATINRRTFLIRSSTVVAAAGAAAVIPGVLTMPAGADTAKAAALANLSGHGEGSAAATMSEPLLAEIRNLSTGEIALFSGEQEFILHDPQMARKLFSTVR